MRSNKIYTPTELETIHACIGELPNWAGTDWPERATAAVSDGRCPSRLFLLWPLSESQPALFDKLLHDPLVESHSIYGLFPGLYEWVYGNGPPPQVSWEGRTRGRVGIFQKDNAGLVVKPLQNRREDEIAAIAGGLGVGPQQLPSLPGFLTEEYAPGAFFTDLPPQLLTGDFLRSLGVRLGRMLRSLHRTGIYYNDATLSDPDGRSHLLVTEDGQATLIDFGVSVLLDNHPQLSLPRLSLEEVYNVARTDPNFQLFARLGVSQADMTAFLRQYRQTLAAAAPRDIMARDLTFFQQGLRQASAKMGDHIAAPMEQGFNEGYYQG